MNDCNFAYINYQKGKSHLEWGNSHGEEFKDAINELVEIRTNLMLEKNPLLRNKLDELAKQQFEISKNYSPHLADELEGIAKGSNKTITEIVILNNYTDFRDIELNEEGCSTIHIQRGEKSFSGQTWDMHSSAKRFVNVIHIPKNDHSPEHIVFSLVGCLGMMGLNTHKCFIGVNNINTKNAKAGLIWPLLVRSALETKNFNELERKITSAPVTSGHNYIISTPENGAHWEITPEEKECIGKSKRGDASEIFHTNHCLGEKIKKIEDPQSSSSTTHNRFEILAKKTPLIETNKDLISLLKDHEGHPKSICSHYESGKQDPSMTCGGGVVDFQDLSFHLWRGCQEYDKKYQEYNFILKNESFQLIT